MSGRQAVRLSGPHLDLMACPICVSPEGTAITVGIRAGAGVLILVTAIVIGLIARFGYRLWAAEGAAEGSEITNKREVMPAHE